MVKIETKKNKQMKTILVPTDFSDHALYALKVAAGIAKKMNAEIKLVHAYDLSSSTFSENYYYEEFHNQIKDQAEVKLNKLVDMDILKEIEVSKHIETNILIRKLVTHKNYKDVDLIVMGAHGTSGHSEVFIGSNTEKMNAPSMTECDMQKRWQNMKFFQSTGLISTQIRSLHILNTKNTLNTKTNEENIK